MKLIPLIILLTLSLWACVPSKPQQSLPSVSIHSSSSSSESADISEFWRYYESDDFGISFFYPAIYDQITREAGNTVQISESESFPYDEKIRIVKGIGGEVQQIMVLKTRDSRIVKYVQSGPPVETVIIGERRVQVTQWPGMGDTKFFLLKMKDVYLLFSFTAPPSDEIMHRVIASIREI